jgi:hypothetical protein
MTNDFANHPTRQPMQSAHAYTGFLSILQSLCSLPFVALRAVVDFFAPPTAFELHQRQCSATRQQVLVPEHAPTAAPTTSLAPGANSSPVDSTTSTTTPHAERTKQKIAINDRPTVTLAKKTLKTGLTMQHGRIIISGRMADVCAELERLAALEAAQA